MILDRKMFGSPRNAALAGDQPEVMQVKVIEPGHATREYVDIISLSIPEELHLSHPTISKQLHQLEASFEDKLFDRVGRNLVLTEFGQTVFRYAEEIFSVGRELQDAVQGRPVGRPLKFEVGIPEVIPEFIAHRLLAPAFRLSEDSALMKVFGQDGIGLFPAPTVIENEVCRQGSYQKIAPWQIRFRPSDRPEVLQLRPSVFHAENRT